MELDAIARWGKIKGIKLVATGDFTHPLYFAEIKSKLEPVADGIYRLKQGEQETLFILCTEVSNIFTQGQRTNRRTHTLIFAPNIETVEHINTALGRLGKLGSDGRPIFGFPTKDLVKMILDISDKCLLVPAHAWTPWFSVFGANSGFDSLEECFEEQTKNISAIETGLSSDPEMNWRLSALDGITLISNSDAHSPNKLGREANAFACALEYPEICRCIKEKDPTGLLFTVEFFPEEGKYHYDGHRNCNVLFTPQESKAHNNICPVCGKQLTVGVMHRVEELADRKQGFVPKKSIPSIHLIPLEEIIAEALEQGPNTKGVQQEYMRMVEQAGSEFAILIDLPSEEIKKIAPPRVYEGIMLVRQGKLKIVPGYDGVYGRISIFPKEGEAEKPANGKEQMSLF
ncbi:MAG: DNA helicase UvrD [Deltaproteobacteria bacterium RBG_13_52_11]|nr:MAG: DNA helicase UvrD [Deltaproteobacteria bacterium RBG_13_52_11]